VSFLRRKPTDGTPPAASEAVIEESSSEEASPAVGKGRPTPKRREAEGRRGPVAPPPKTQREAMKRAKVQGKSMTKEERRALSRANREKMMSGDDKHLLPRDRGKARAYVRDLVDTRRNIAGILLPIALLSFVILLIPIPVVQAYGPLVLLVAIFAAIIDSVIFGKQLSKKVRAKFPNGDNSGQSTKGSALGFYAFNRACLIRRWRVPRPRVEPGTKID
jgi:hypothetical protein